MEMKDNYEHKEIDIIYITESIPGPAENTLEYQVLLGNYNSQMLDNCYCAKNCVKFLCRCLKISHGDNYNRYALCDGNLNYVLNHKSSVFRDYPIIECNSNCKCSAACGNRVVQNGPMEGLIVKPCENNDKGLGLFTPHFIHKGTFICEYAGELLTKTQALQRTKENEAQGKMNYIFCLNEHTYEGFIQTFVDPSKFGNIGRYINHSCEPNSWVVPVRCEIAIPRLAIFACSNILPGEEITFSYSSGNDDNLHGSKIINENNVDDKTSNEDNVASSQISIKKKCLCKSAECKGFLPFEDF